MKLSWSKIDDLSEGDVTCMATIPFDMEVEAYFLAKEDGIVAGVALADMIFEHVDPSLKVFPSSYLKSFDLFCMCLLA